MPLSTFLQGLGQQAGYQVLYSQEKKAQDQALEMRQQQIEAGKIDLQERQAQQQSRLATMSGLKMSIAEGKDASEQVALLRKAQLTALANNDLDAARTINPMIKGLEEEVDRTKGETALKLQRQKDSTAASAIDYLSTKTPESADKVMKDYIAAGGDPRLIPPPGETFDKWVEARQLDGMTGSKKAEFLIEVQRKKEEAKSKQEDADARNAETARHNREMEQSKEQARELSRGLHAAVKKTSDINNTEKLNNSLQKAAKPLTDDRNLVEVARGWLMTNDAYSDQQARQALTALSSQFKGRATNIYYKDNKYFGDVANVIYGVIARPFTGKYTEPDRKGLLKMLDDMEQKVIDPALNNLEQGMKKRAKGYDLDPDQVELQGDFTRTKPLPEGASTSKTIGGVT